MIAFKEKEAEIVKQDLIGVKSIGIVSCGGCPALQKKGGTVGIERWANYLKHDFEVKWALVTPRFCDKRLFRIYIDELSERLEEVDAVVAMVCDAGATVANEVFGFPCISCVDTLYFGIMEENGEIKRFAYLQRDGVG